MAKMQTNVLKRHEIRAVFRKNRGAAAALARELQVTDKTISAWLKGRMDSRRVAAAAQERAVQLLQGENCRAA